jgi:hypothetical protein
MNIFLFIYDEKELNKCQIILMNVYIRKILPFLLRFLFLTLFFLILFLFVRILYLYILYILTTNVK